MKKWRGLRFFDEWRYRVFWYLAAFLFLWLSPEPQDGLSIAAISVVGIMVSELVVYFFPFTRSKWEKSKKEKEAA